MLLLLCGVSNGIADFSQKLFMKQIPNGSAFVFNFYTYVFASLVLIAFLVLKRKTANTTNPADFKKIFTYILIMAICLFANSYFKTLAAQYLDAINLYPLNQGSAVVLSLLMSSILFKEKITAKCIIGIALSFVALLMINLL
jgi:drug/metabolite transporter (DMT)-like permease